MIVSQINEKNILPEPVAIADVLKYFYIFYLFI